MMDISAFQCVSSMRNVSMLAARPETVGNTTFFGQIAHLIDTLHLSYTEVFEVIPYRNLLMMQRDKLHAVYGGQKVNRISGKELANRRKKK